MARVARDGIIRKRPNESGTLLHLVGIDLEKIGRLLDFAQRFHSILADFQRRRGGNVVDTLLDQPGRLAHQRDPAAPVGGTPALECIGCRPHGSVHLGGPGDLKLSQDPSSIDGAAFEGFSIREDIASADEQSMLAALRLADPNQRAVEQFMQLGRSGEHGGVGQLESGHRNIPSKGPPEHPARPL